MAMKKKPVKKSAVKEKMTGESYGSKSAMMKHEKGEGMKMHMQEMKGMKSSKTSKKSPKRGK